MLICYDISTFMTWFLSQVLSIFTFVFSTLNSIEFMGTSLLKVLLTITIIGALLPVLLTVVNTQGIKAERRSRERSKKNDK